MEKHQTTDRPLSAAELGQCLGTALATGADAMALLDRRSGRLLWCSDVFAREFADARIGVVWHPWSAAMAGQCQSKGAPYLAMTRTRWLASQESHSVAGLASAADPLIQTTGSAGQQLTLSSQRVSERCSLVRSWPPGTPARQLHQYLQVRNDLLVTASTLSVGEMATTLAHEINQPVGTIVNLLQGVKSRLHRDSQAQGDIDKACLRRDRQAQGDIDSALDKALGQARFMASIVSRIRDFTQERRPSMQRHDVSTLIQEALGLLDWLLSTQACRLEFERPTQPTRVICDATLFQQVIINLVRNAIEAMHDTPVAERVLAVGIESADGEVRIAISDRGHGLVDGAEALFVPFATRKPKGMGVGLNICRSFIELHQGRLWLTPNSAAGCTAWVSLPDAQYIPEVHDA